MQTILGEIKDNPTAPMNAETLKACIRLWHRRGCPTLADQVILVTNATRLRKVIKKVGKKERQADPYGNV